ncbi:hypothetical protein [Staphylococcus aureus]|nr:hypothetical protein [Staphylococcus aureus]SUL46224.1 Uncharacterised protein [Staphylococcus aureus]
MSGKGHEVGNTVTVTFPDGKTATSKVDEKGQLDSRLFQREQS